MPCHTIRNISLNLHIADREALIAALTKLGYQPEEREVYIAFWINGRYCTIGIDTITVPQGYEDVVNEIKQETSRQIVERIAARQRWNIKKVSENKYKVTRRY